jgi:hypothetical protein
MREVALEFWSYFVEHQPQKVKALHFMGATIL